MSQAALTPRRGPVQLSVPPPAGRLVSAVAVLVISFSLVETLSGSGQIVNWGGWPLAWRFLSAAWHPTLDRDSLALTSTATITTVAFALCGSIVSLGIGAIGGLFASECWWEIWATRSRNPEGRLLWAAKVVRAVLAVPRGVHELVWGLFLINILGLDPLVAVLAIGLPFGTITAKVFAEILDETPRTSALCFRVTGASALVAFAYGVLPRALPLLLSYALYRFECAVRSAAILGLIGAGGLGYQVMLSLQSLQYQQVWTFLYALMVLIAVTDWGSSRLIKALSTQSAASAEKLAQQLRSHGLLGAAVVAMGVGSYSYLGLDVGKLVEPRRLQMLKEILAESIPPRFVHAELPLLLKLSLQTVAMSIVAIVIAGLGAIVVSWFATQVLFERAGQAQGPRHWIVTVFSATVRAGLIATRALSDGIWVLLVLLLLFPGSFAGAVALGAYNFGVLGRLLTQVNEAADKRVYWALRAQGASFTSAVLYGLLPLTFPKYLAYILYRWEVCVRATVVVGIVGAGGLGRRLEQQLASFDYRSAVATLTFYVVLTLMVDAVSSSGRRALSPAQ